MGLDASNGQSMSNLRVREVWSDNLELEMSLIRDVVETYTNLAMDTEFPGVVVRPVGNFKNHGDYHYQTLRANVDMLKLIQVGLTFCNDDGDLPVIDGEPCIWQFNFREFKLHEDMYAHDSIEMLKQCGIDFDAHERRGVDVKAFGELLITSGVVLNSKVRWITFHSAYDFGYLLRVCTGAHLPPTEEDFADILKEFFPNVYDMKYLMKFCDLHGGLGKLAESLGVDRVGQQHQAGSDSLLTAKTFLKMIKSYFQGMESIVRHCNVVQGLGVDGQHDLLDG